MNLKLTDSIIMYSNFTDPPPDYEPLQGEIVPLDDQDFIAADRMSQRIAQANQFDQQQWSIYRHYLALQALRRWFGQRTTPVSIDETEATILTPETANAQAALCHLQIGPFQLCLVVTDGSSDDWQLPQAIVQAPNLAAHFYLVVVIHEESNQAEILGFLRHDQIPVNSLEQDTYNLAIDDLNPNLDTLLLYLSCLEPSAIPLPITPTVAVTNPASTNLRQLLIQPVLSTRQWLNQQLDTLTDAIAWQLLPPWEMATATRSLRQPVTSSPMDRLSEILTNLVRGGMTLPIEHRPAYRDLNLGSSNLRLYIITASQEQTANLLPEWSLLVILCQQDGSDLPLGTRLQIQDATTTLVDRQTDTDRFDYLYAKVSGEQTEAFIVTISHSIDTLTLPPFSFQ